jgi:hypothetical protein
MGRRLGSALKYTWTETEKTVLPEEQEAFNAELIQEEREAAKREAEKGEGRACHVYGRVTDGEWSCRIRGGMEGRPILEGY